MPWPHFTPGKDPVPIVQETGWAPGPVWTDGKSRSHRDSIPDRPARSQSLYRLSYRAHVSCKIQTINFDTGDNNAITFVPYQTTVASLKQNIIVSFDTLMSWVGSRSKYRLSWLKFSCCLNQSCAEILPPIGHGPEGAWDSSLLQNVQTGSGAYPVSMHLVPGLFPWGLSGRCLSLNTHLHLVPRLRISGVNSTLPYPLCTFSNLLPLILG